MKIIREKTTLYEYAFVFEYSYEIIDYCRYLKEIYGWKDFSFVDNKWRFNNIDIAISIKQRFNETEIDDDVVVDFALAEIAQEERIKQEQNAERIKSSLDSDIEINDIKGELRPYQKIGVEFFLNNNGKAILSDQMGTGKTCQSLAYITTAKKKRSLVICPASVKYSWKKEIEKWTDLSYLIVNSKTELTSLRDKTIDVFVINYDIVKKFYNTLIDMNFDCIIIDEFTYIKNNSATRTKAVKQIAKKIDSVILLSGTPMLSRPSELFNGLNLIDPKTWKSFYDFTVRYCQGHRGPWGWDYRGASNIEELQKRINKYFLRRTKEDILPELPQKIFINVPVELDQETQSEYDMALNQFGKFLREIKGKKTTEVVRSLQAEKLTKLGALRQLTTMGKIKAAEELIQEIIDGGEKVLVFSCYNEPLEQLHQKFVDTSVMLTGKTSEKDRGNIIEKFQNDKNTNIFFGGTKSAGIGITLTAATNVLFIDYSWTPADHSQAIDRAHRIGSTSDHITIYTLSAIGTIDEYMTKLLEKKQILFDRLIDGSGVTKKAGSRSVVNDVLKMIEKGSAALD
jgi:SWI/SNF-related matrix-associated actin-dependent regulator 1 of chromatin subfamily A